MEDSILRGTKKILGVADDYTAFDHDIITHINSAFSTLAQLGVGPLTGFMIMDDNDTWTDFLGELPDFQFNSVKSYVFLKTRMLFDPPTTSYLISATEKQIEELEWRLNVRSEQLNWVDPSPVIVDEEVVDILDGGGV